MKSSSPFEMSKIESRSMVKPPSGLRGFGFTLQFGVKLWLHRSIRGSMALSPPDKLKARESTAAIPQPRAFISILSPSKVPSDPDEDKC
mmetsp:Transcript_16015/g.25631  ORF Transcript_16015/g.25631 Transcript_16015/m.25631 type:complete len:89 (+) Transcript_16015:296-562(+)